MKPYFILTVILCLIMILFPFLAKTLQKNEENTTSTELSSIFADKAASEYETASETVSVLRTASGNVTDMKLFDYLVGTVAGEMPASFCREALKAQAVVSYTYAKWILENSESGKSYISDSSALHQKYIDENEQKEKWQANYEANRQRIEDAVKSVYGKYLSFEGETAMTVFHALSSGKTLSAAQVWGKDIPYLKQVEAPGDTLSEKLESVITYTADEFRQLFEEEGLKFESDEIGKWASVKEKSEDGYIRKLTVCSEDFTARQIRKILSLPSESFTAKIENNCFVFTTYGKGHGVGMSQYSADYMARQGKSYKEILAHFYPGTVLMEN